MILITSCTKSEEGSSSNANASWSTDATINSLGEYAINVGDQIVFTDLSENTLSHQWIIEDGCSFASTSGSESSNAVETVSFDEEGFYTVTLYNTYSSDVSDAMNSIAAYHHDDAWVVEQQFWVNVYGDLSATLLVVAAKSDGDVEVITTLEEGYEIPTNTELWSNVTITTSDRIVFIDLSEEGADSWNINYADQSVVGSNGSIDVQFSEPATYSDFEYQVSRTSPTAQITKAVPIIIEVTEDTNTSGGSGGETVGESILSDAELSLYGYDNAYSTNYWTSNTSGLYYTLVTDTVAAGTGALRFYHEDDITSDDGVVAYMTNGSATDQHVLVSPGKYKITHKVYVVDTGIDTSAATYVIEHKGGVTGSITWSDYLDADTEQSTSYTIPETTGEWVDVERMVYFTYGDLFNEKIVIRLTMPEGTPGGLEIYFDDFNFYPVI